ncbi:Uncharacterised protein [Candidatus Venteria ishoeyi]|uniref:Uncharacterized protein n=1 Tax=Candidatus Venteria ishoeyi TaxID=1899563 RepID=A0A1H6F6M4_9GAMM|nr:Uncharacterised protein [Candidatus Venteria ishoeyi]
MYRPFRALVSSYYKPRVLPWAGMLRPVGAGMLRPFGAGMLRPVGAGFAENISA